MKSCQNKAQSDVKHLHVIFLVLTGGPYIDRHNLISCSMDVTHSCSGGVSVCVGGHAKLLRSRAHLSDINWTLMAEKLFSAEDMKKVWYYIGKEVHTYVHV